MLNAGLLKGGCLCGKTGLLGVAQQVLHVGGITRPQSRVQKMT